jgi:putative membrane protein
LPAELLGRWNLDPILLAALVAIALAYEFGARRSGYDSRRILLFRAGWAITAAALISPLCPLSVSLFAARISQHMILCLLGAPLVALGRPATALWRAFASTGSPFAAGAAASKMSMVAAGFFAVLLWYWHAPTPYEITFGSALVYWLMHLTLYGSALWLWSTLLSRATGQAAAWTLAAGLFSTVQMGLLGALVTLAPSAIYRPHFLTTYAWGLTPLQDQQIGGAIMWVPGCVVFLVAALAELAVLTIGPAGRSASRSMAR